MPPKASAVSLLGLSDYALRTAVTLRDRLVGHTGVKDVNNKEEKSDGESPLQMIETPAEEGLKEVFAKSDSKFMF